MPLFNPAVGVTDHGALSGLADDDHPQYETAAEVAAQIGTHSADTTSVHGIADTSALATATDLSTHAADTTSVHGIADTAVLATDAEVATAVSDHSADTTSVHGIADTAGLALAVDVDTLVDDHNANTFFVHGIANTATLYRSGGTDVALADGGTGASLADPGADRIMFWDDSAGATAYLEASTGLTVTGTALTANVPITCRATADHALSQIAKTNVTGMAMTLAANTNYLIEFYLRCSANAATVGVQYAITFGGTVTRFDGNLDYYITVSAKGSVDVVNDTTSPFDFNPTVSHGNVVLMNCIYGLLEVGASGGTLQLQHGSETATLTTVFRGSYGRATVVA